MASSSERTPVLIVGAGPSGLILALTLAQNNVPVRILEKETAFRTGQRGPGIQPRSLELMHFLGVLSDIVRRAMHFPMTCVYKMPEGTELVSKAHLAGSPVDPTPDIPFPNTLVLGQACSEEIMRSHLAKLDVHVELGMELIGVEQDENGVTAKVVRHGQQGSRSEETIFADWLVSAEGGKSTARKQLGLDFLGETRDFFRFLLADAEVSGVSREYCHAWGDFKTRYMMIRPTEDENISSITIVAPELERAMESHEGFVELVHSINNRKELEIGEVIWKTLWRPNIRIVKEYRKGRVFLIGDAAHVHTPAGGQGANTGMQDGFNLGWKLSLIHKGLATESLVDTFQEERHPVAKEVLVLTTGSFDSMLKSGKKPPAMWSLYRQLGVNYRWSSIVVDEQPSPDPSSNEMLAYLPDDNTELRAGDRAPDAPGLVPLSSNTATSTSLFDIFRPTRHTVLLFDPTAEQVEAVKETLASSRIPKDLLHTTVILPSQHGPNSEFSGVDEVLVDTSANAYSAYHPVQQGFNIFVVRPDGVLGAVLKGADGLRKYLNGIFTK
ncbi:FAD binding domain-containing protein [Cytidiella melzeri]|nr:FAD binding domain-containing protein [Cytidiella melzeri]